MQNVSIQKASQLPPSVKSAVEQLLGRPIGADEEVSVAAVPPQQILPSKNRAMVAANLEAFLNRRAAKTRDTLDEDLEAAVVVLRVDDLDPLGRRVLVALDENIPRRQPVPQAHVGGPSRAPRRPDPRPAPRVELEGQQLPRLLSPHLTPGRWIC